MFGWFTYHVLALVLVAALFGGMLFFAALFAPMVFRNLPREEAAAFMRGIFPVYHRIMGIVAILAILPLAPQWSYGPEVALLAAVAAGFVFANTVLRPRIDAARDSGRTAAFRRLHRASVVLNMGQLAAVTVVLVRLAQ
jgi:hypothetical protein